MGSGHACAKRSLAVLAGDTIRSESLVIYAHFSFVYMSIQIINQANRSLGYFFQKYPIGKDRGLGADYLTLTYISVDVRHHLCDVEHLRFCFYNERVNAPVIE